MTLHDATVIALRHNREIRAEVEEIARSRADLAQAGLLPNPMLSVAVRFPNEGVTAVGRSLMQEFTALWLRPAKMGGAVCYTEHEHFGDSRLIWHGRRA